MAVTRAQVDSNGNAENTTTPFVDQNQTYTSHPSHQVFLREFVRIDIGDGNRILGTQAGSSNTATVTQAGDNNATVFSQMGGFNGLVVNQ